MRKLIMSACAGCVMALSGNLFASGKLMDYVPSGVDGMVEIKVQKILDLPAFKEAVKKNKDLGAGYADFEAELKKVGLTDKDMPSQAVVFFKKDGSVGGVVAKTTVTQDKLQKLLAGESFKDLKLVTKDVNGRKVFEAGNDPTAFTYLESDVLLITDKSMIGQIIDAAKGDNKQLLDKVTGVDKNALVWFVYHSKVKNVPQSPEAGPGNPVDGIETVGASLDFVGKGQTDIVLDGEITCKDEAAAAGLGMQANGVIMMMVPMAFSLDPQLGIDASKAIKINTQGNKINAKISVPKALHDRLIEYSQKMQEQQAQQAQQECSKTGCPAPAQDAEDPVPAKVQVSGKK